jgi:hypothetical protein
MTSYFRMGSPRPRLSGGSGLLTLVYELKGRCRATLAAPVLHQWSKRGDKGPLSPEKGLSSIAAHDMPLRAIVCCAKSYPSS